MICGRRCDVKKALSKEEIKKIQQQEREREERGKRKRGGKDSDDEDIVSDSSGKAYGKLLVLTTCPVADSFCLISARISNTTPNIPPVNLTPQGDC